MNVLIITETYPNDCNPYQMMYVHNRSVYYKSCGLDVTVLSFRSESDYEYDGIKVISTRTAADLDSFDAIFFHAPNLRNHIRYYIRNRKKIADKAIFVIHGHEALDYTKYYFGDYSGTRKILLRSLYEKVKLKILGSFFSFNKDRLRIFFVSEWMKSHFSKNLKIDANEFKHHIIYNSVNPIFEQSSWNESSKKEYDFVTIRPLTELKYGSDIVIKLAVNNPSKKFLLVGKGNIFNYLDKPENVYHIDKFLSPENIKEILDSASCALMPTRLDAQGVMACEMATYGVPLVTSDIEVCREVFNGFDNVSFISNDEPKLPNIKLGAKAKKFIQLNTCGKEVQVLRTFYGGEI